MSVACVKRTESPTGEAISIVTGLPIPDNRLDMACECCFNGLSVDDVKARPDAYEGWGWPYERDDLCPACEQERQDGIEAFYQEFVREREMENRQ